MITLLCSALVAILLAELLNVAFGMNWWRLRANALEYAVLSIPDAPSDKAQERLFVAAALNLFGLVVYLWGVLALIFLVVSVFTVEAKLNNDIFLWATSVCFFAYAWLRERVRKDRGRIVAHQVDTQKLSGINPIAGYSRIARWLHWLALELKLVRSVSFELEKALFLKTAWRSARIKDQPVYVMGLARSGTTVVLEILERTGKFVSPTYRDMPFVLCPNFWKSLTRFARIEARLVQRAHGDGINVGFDSPESFEEVFWRTACQAVPGNALAYEPITPEALADFAAYRQLSVLSGLQTKHHEQQLHVELRYLSKNNNNILRLKELVAQPKTSVVLIMRDPLATAWSLYLQHLRFGQMQTDNPFVRAYMRWLGHYEFGHGHKPLVAGSTNLHGLKPDQPDYWLAYWLGIHNYLWKTFDTLSADQQARVCWVSHEKLCSQPVNELTRVFQHLHIEQAANDHASTLHDAVVASDLVEKFDRGLAQNAKSIHQKILERVTA